MFHSFYGKNSSSGSDISRLFNFNPTLYNLGASNDVLGDGLTSSHSLVFESEKREQVKYSATAGVGNNEISEDKALAALKNHREAERRRRDRINDHFATLRGLVPSSEKMDKATLLTKVVNQVKELRKEAVEASKGILIPMDADEVKVAPYDDDVGDGSISYRATICCDYRAEMLSDIRQTLNALKLQLVRAEISTLGDRMKNVFVFTCCKGNNIDTEACQAIASTVHEALSSVLDKASSSLEYTMRMSHPSKRRRLCFIETSSSSCNHGSCSC
ncbi:transcription factor bHLH106-like [Gastrolobium bilobum]|uniref:transcription factor bHLH106-like n=1 Tax=Gastrolobium bilobum TaxID=150636 RepID=UPI002AB30B61|nr:transcription factor bHLH106-like [Gastrolobium bilobum]